MSTLATAYSGQCSYGKLCKNKLCSFQHEIESDEDYENELKSEENTSKDPTIDEPVTCELCWTEFSSTKLLKKHTIQNHTFKEDRTLKCCPHCDHKVKKLGNLKRHIESKHTDHAEKKYFCEKCNEGHMFKHSLNVHYYIKHSDFVCEVCGKAFKNKIYLNQHKYIKHKPKEKNDGINKYLERCSSIAHFLSQPTPYKYGQGYTFMNWCVAKQ